MDTVVCVKRVPFTQEADLEIDADKKGVRKDMLPFVINEWDNYAIEEAIQLKDRLGAGCPYRGRRQQIQVYPSQYR